MSAEYRLDARLRERLRENLAGFERRAHARQGRRPAAVSIVVTDDGEGRACFLITRRPDTLSRHAGQWALPGGRLDAGETPLDAALRELEEELGVALDDTHVLGALDDYSTRSGFVITPVVLWGGAGCRVTPDPSEVAAYYRVPLSELEKPEVPEIESIPESDRPVIVVPMIGHRINAPTAALLYQFREVALRGLHTRVDHFEQPVFAWS